MKQLDRLEATTTILVKLLDKHNVLPDNQGSRYDHSIEVSNTVAEMFKVIYKAVSNPATQE